MGVRYYMVLSDAAKAQARENPDLKLVDQSNAWAAVITESGKPAESKTRNWEVYEVAKSDIVAPLGYEPVVMRGVPKGGPGWQKASVEWFNADATRWDIPLAASGPKEWARVNGTPSDPPRRAVKPATVSNIRTEDDRISFDVDQIGTPVLVKASYFPNWQASGARGPWRVTPNSMVVIPTSRHVTLHYGNTPVDRTGWALALLGLVGVVFLARRRVDDPVDRGAAGDSPALSAAVPGLPTELEPQAPQPVH